MGNLEKLYKRLVSEPLSFNCTSNVQRPNSSIMKLPWFSGSQEALISTAQDSASTPEALRLGATIPPTLPERARTLVLCFDGTGDKCVLLFHCRKHTDTN